MAQPLASPHGTAPQQPSVPLGGGYQQPPSPNSGYQQPPSPNGYQPQPPPNGYQQQPSPPQQPPNGYQQQQQPPQQQPPPTSSPTTARPLTPLPPQYDSTKTNGISPIPFTFHALRNFIRQQRTGLYIGQYLLQHQRHMIKIVCRCVSKYTPPPTQYQPQPQEQIIFVDISGQWTCYDASISSWVQIGDVIELYVVVSPNYHHHNNQQQQQYYQQPMMPQQQQQQPQVQIPVEPIIDVVHITVLTIDNDECLKQCQSLLSNSQIDSTTSPNPLYLKSHPATYYDKFQQHLNTCRIWYMNNGYTKEYIMYILKHKLAFLLELENPYYIIPLNQQDLSPQSQTITIDIPTRRIIYANLFDITDRLISRVVHVTTNMSCPQIQTQICTPECQQCTLDDYCGHFPINIQSLPLGIGTDGILSGATISTQIDYYPGQLQSHELKSTTPIQIDSYSKSISTSLIPYVAPIIQPILTSPFPLITNLYPDQQAQYPPPQTLYNPHALQQQQQILTQQRIQQQQYFGMAKTMMMTPYGTITPSSSTTTNVNNTTTTNASKTALTTQPNPTIPSSSVSHFDMYRYTYIPAPRPNTTIYLITQLIFPLQPQQQQIMLPTGQLIPNNGPQQIDIIYNTLSTQYIQSIISEHLTQVQTFHQIIPILYTDIKLQTNNMSFGSYYTYHGEKYQLIENSGSSIMTKELRSKRTVYCPTPTLFITNQSINKHYLYHFKEHFLHVTFDQIFFATPYGKTQLLHYISSSSNNNTPNHYKLPSYLEDITTIPDWCIKTPKFTTIPLYTPGLILTTTGFITCHENNDLVTGFQLFDGSTSPREFLAGRNYVPIHNHDLRWGSNRDLEQYLEGLPSFPLNKTTITSSSTKSKSTTTTKSSSSKAAAATPPPTTQQNTLPPFTLSGGFRNQIVIKLFFRVKIDTLHSNIELKDKIFHYELLAYETLPCTSFVERDQYIHDNLFRSLYNDHIIYYTTLDQFEQHQHQSTLSTIASTILSTATAVVSHNNNDDITTPTPITTPTLSFNIRNAIKHGTFFYNPDISIPILFSQLNNALNNGLNNGAKYYATTTNYITNDAKQFYQTDLTHDKIYTNIVRLMSITTSIHNDKYITSIKVRDSNSTEYSFVHNTHFFNLIIGSSQWPNDLNIGSIIQIYFTFDPRCNVDGAGHKELIIGIKIIKKSTNGIGDQLTLDYFQNIIKPSYHASYFAFWDELIARKVARIICHDFAIVNNDESILPPLH